MKQSFRSPRDHTEASGSQVVTRASRLQNTRQPSVHSQPQGASLQSASKSQQFALAYLTTEYPKTSHTFIRREILELERSGQPVIRLAIRESDSPAVDPADIVEHERTGLLVDAGDAAGLAQAIERVLSDPSLAQRLGNAGRERVLERYSWDRVVERLHCAYRELLTSG